MFGDINGIPDELSQLDDYLAERESKQKLKPGTEARILWDQEKSQKTEYSLVYLHGFSASHPEGAPVHKAIADKFGYNLYLSRLAEHGIKNKFPLLQLSERKLIRSARFALEIGRRIGKKVILMGTSTGGALSLYLASRSELKSYISALILYAPLIRFYKTKAALLGNTPVRKLLRYVPGSKYLIKKTESTFVETRIWNKSYALGGALTLGNFIHRYMTKDLFSRVTCPAFIGYYYKNSRQRDKVISVKAIRKMAKHLGSRTDLLTMIPYPEAGNHVICSSLLSKTVENVIGHTSSFLKRIGSHTAREEAHLKDLATPG